MAYGVKATLLSNASATGSWVDFPGGKAGLAIMGTLATTTKLQMLGQDGSTAIDVATISAAGYTSYDLPRGQYRISLASGSPANIYADLHRIHY
jgi:hypothetical protein